MIDQNMQELIALRAQMSQINAVLRRNLNEFFRLSNAIGQGKDKLGLPHFDPVRESEMLHEVLSQNPGPMPDDLLKRVFKEIFKASVEEMGVGTRQKLQVNRLPGGKDLVMDVHGIEIGGKNPVLMAGPCSVENYEQLHTIAKTVSALGVKILRGGAFKPRTSPYSFQGLEKDALQMLRAVADEFDMIVISEVLDTKDIELVETYVDILQVGARNMFNYALLKELGRIHKPVMLKRGFMATIDEFIMATEYIYIGGNTQLILCERGIRTFETQTRNTLDISSIPILKKETPLPIIVDVSHALGRKDIVKPIALAALAAGANGLMFEVHHNPPIALSDTEQQLNLQETAEFIRYLEQAVQLLH